MSDERPLPYGLSWWLDAATDQSWRGLVAGDYAAVLPLPRLARARVLPAYLRPPFTQQLGPYGSHVSPATLAALLSAIPRQFQLALPLRPDVEETCIPPRFARRRRVNFTLDLSRPLDDVVSGFPKRMRGYYRQYAADDALERIDGAEFVAFNRDELKGRGGLRDFHWRRLLTIIRAVEERERGGCYCIRHEGELLSAAFYPALNGRVFNLAAASTDAGRRLHGMERMFFQLIRRRAGTPGAVLDFEGSELPGVRRFFGKFGGKDEGYWLVEEKLWGLR